MGVAIVRYTSKPERADEHQALTERDATLVGSYRFFGSDE